MGSHHDHVDDDKFRFAIDRGGTFTDIFALCPNGRIRVLKLLSHDPDKYPDAPTEGIRRILEEELGNPISVPIDSSLIAWIRMGTTVATNALLERTGERVALAVTAGFKDLLLIGNQARPDLFDLRVRTPDLIYERVIEIQERIITHDDRCQLDKKTAYKFVDESSLYIAKELDLECLRRDLQNLKDDGFDSLAVVLMHSYAFPDHEKIVAEIAKTEFQFKHVSLSSSVMPMVKIVPRGFTAAVDAYLTPCIKRYLDGFIRGFRVENKPLNVLFMQSDGGLTPMEFFTGSRAIISGPAGGVVGYAHTTVPDCSPIIGFDMGGTSTDVSRYHGSFEHVYDSSISGIAIQTPQLDVNTVAAGGGSVLQFRSGLFVVGPGSAGAHPGPTCYRKNGPLAVTDANLILGRILPEYFPKIFGPEENLPLDRNATRDAFRTLTDRINAEIGVGSHMTMEEVAMGFIRVANEAMCRPIRALTQGKGHDTSVHVLACFGGAGGQHACAIARSLSMKTVFVHKYAGILSAYGMALADVVEEQQVSCLKEYVDSNYEFVETVIAELKDKSMKEIREKNKNGTKFREIVTETFLNLRYEGTECALMCSASKIQDFGLEFLKRYETEFGFVLKNRSIIIDDIRVRTIGRSDVIVDTETTSSVETKIPNDFETVEVYFESGYESTKVFFWNKLEPGQVLHGPAIIIDQLSTILIEPDCVGTIDTKGNLKIDIGIGRLPNDEENDTCRLDPIQLSIFSHRFMSIAEQMGRTLQRTAVSTNIKERLDFSCALFGPDGGLVSNAPHIPVHLGAMQETVQYQIRNAKIRPGDVLLANHPKAGGSHLPDLTVITPVFLSKKSEHDSPVFYVANRGHHADIGGISPGSMPPHSKSLIEEGAAFMSFKLVENGIFQEEKLIMKLNEPGEYPGCSGTRCLPDNLSDLKAQIAANQKGIKLVTELIDYYGLSVVQAYMSYIQSNAELAVKDVLKIASEKLGKSSSKLVQLRAHDFMDDGSKINLSVDIDTSTDTAVFDFTGTGYEVWGNTNAPKAVTSSAVIYALRCLVGHDIPLNQGCLNPIRIVIPEGSLLDPSETAAVVGGNVLTSQRIVDVIFKAFEAVAASHGCCNNVTFGDDTFGYYETVAGGSGAGPEWSGRSGVHVHMTNTRLTDPEILERRYPVILDRFCLADGTGGIGKYFGGNGVIREIRFRKDLTLSVLTERRVLRPYGLAGGQPGASGLNLLIRNGKPPINLGGKCSVKVGPGDIFSMRTPGGGGYGNAPNELFER